MKTTKLLLTVTLLVTLLYSCQKEVKFLDDNQGGGTGGNPSSKSIIGDYNFVGITADTRTTVTVSQLGLTAKTITTSNYTSTNNSGTAKFTSNQFSYTNIAYSISTTSHVKLYLDDQLLNEQDLPTVLDAPGLSGSETYVKNNNDSLTFANPIFVAGAPFGSTITPAPMGAKISWAGDTLILKIKHTINGTITQGGVPGNFSGFLDGVFKLKKK